MLGYQRVSPVWAENLSHAGGTLTSPLPRNVLLELPSPAIRTDSEFQTHLEGHSLFHRSFRDTRVHGKPVLGPHFNNDSCGSCHVRVGRGPVELRARGPGNATIIKVSARQRRSRSQAPKLPGVGEQLQDRTRGGATRFRIRIRWKKVSGTYADGTRYNLRRPVVSFEVPGYHARDVFSSMRAAPALIGVGLLEAVPSEVIQSLADPEDSNGDGISGRINYVPNRVTGMSEPGRFGFRATHPSLQQITAAALFHDMGITSDIFKGPTRRPELSNLELAKLVFYQQLAGVPGQQHPANANVQAGRELFRMLGCEGCHVPTLHTGNDISPPHLRGQTIHPFTDLLLHDMGPGLADELSEFQASGREWRTAPLWGLGMYEDISPPNVGFLHDGRARSIEEAILWHGGEAQDSRRSYTDLPAYQRAQLITFLRSL
jgi:CxxC motif-containing protein (DUF1111 family)